MPAELHAAAFIEVIDSCERKRYYWLVASSCNLLYIWCISVDFAFTLRLFHLLTLKTIDNIYSADNTLAIQRNLFI